MSEYFVLSSLTASRNTQLHGYPEVIYAISCQSAHSSRGRERGGEGRQARTTIQSILADVKPEAVYFTDDKGQRTALLFLDIQDASQIPAIVEPWMLAFNASIEMHPVMVPDDLTKAGSAIEAAVKKYS